MNPCYPVSFHEPDFCDVNLVVWDRHSVTDAQHGQQVQVSVILPKRLKIIILDNNKKKKKKLNEIVPLYYKLIILKRKITKSEQNIEFSSLKN